MAKNVSFIFRECKGSNVTKSRCFYQFMNAEGKEAVESRPLYGGGKSSVPAGCCLLFTTQLLFTFSAIYKNVYNKKILIISFLILSTRWKR